MEGVLQTSCESPRSRLPRSKDKTTIYKYTSRDICQVKAAAYHIRNRVIREGQVKMCMESLLGGHLHHAGQVGDEQVGRLEGDELGHLKEGEGLVRLAGVVDDQLDDAAVGLEAALVEEHWSDALVPQTLLWNKVRDRPNIFSFISVR